MKACKLDNEFTNWCHVETSEEHKELMYRVLVDIIQYEAQRRLWASYSHESDEA